MNLIDESVFGLMRGALLGHRGGKRNRLSR